MDRDVLKGNLSGILCMVVWSLHFPVSVIVLKTWDAIALAPVRAACAGVTVMAVGLLLGHGRAMLELVRDRWFWVVSSVFGVSGLLFIVGQSRVDAVSAAVIICSMPIFSAIMGWLEGVEKPGARLLLAVALSVVGGVLTSLVSAQGSDSEGSLSGILFVLAAAVAYVWYTRRLVADYSGASDVAKVAVSMLVSAVPCLVVLLFVHAVGQTVAFDMSARTVGLILIMCCVSMGLSSVLWLWTGRVVGVTVAAMHHNMVPFYVMVLASVGGAVVTGQHILGAALVIAGAVLAQLPVRRRRIAITQPTATGRDPRPRDPAGSRSR